MVSNLKEFLKISKNSFKFGGVISNLKKIFSNLRKDIKSKCCKCRKKIYFPKNPLKFIKIFLNLEEFFEI